MEAGLMAQNEAIKHWIDKYEAVKLELKEVEEILYFTKNTLNKDLDEMQNKIHWTSIILAINNHFSQKGNK